MSGLDDYIEAPYHAQAAAADEREKAEEEAERRLPGYCLDELCDLLGWHGVERDRHIEHVLLEAKWEALLDKEADRIQREQEGH